MKEMKPGLYYVGDLCYVLDRDDWSNACEGRPLSGDRPYTMLSTKWGDGVYQSNIGTSHMVDSGTIGCILESDISRKDYAPPYGGALVEMQIPFTPRESLDILVFGHVYIDTLQESDIDP